MKRRLSPDTEIMSKHQMMIERVSNYLANSLAYPLGIVSISITYSSLHHMTLTTGRYAPLLVTISNPVRSGGTKRGTPHIKVPESY